MSNIILIIIEVLISYISLLYLSKQYKTDGIYIFGIIATFIACIMNLKKISIMGIGIPTGLGITTSLIIGGNIITQKRGESELKTYFILILITAILSCLLINLSIQLIPSEYNILINKSYDSIFNNNVKLYLALVLSVLPGIWLSSKLYTYIKKIQNQIILNNIFAIIITEFIENIIFVCIAYINEYSAFNIVLCITTRYIIKLAIGIFGTFPLYLANKYN